jgi:hypothetical protein
MPSPVFIVCSEGGSIDRHTNMLSIFDVIEKLNFKLFDKPPSPDDTHVQKSQMAGMKPMTIHSLRMTAVWRRDEVDIGKEFEFRTLIQLPGVPEPVVAGEGQFVFKTLLHRMIAGFHHDLPQQSGKLIVTSAIREIGSNDWIEQKYVIPVERIESANQRQLPLSDGT